MRKMLATTALCALGLAAAGAPAPAHAQGAGDAMLGQMMTVGFNFCPRGWAAAEGQILPINQNQALYSLLGTTYGGDGRTTFGLPDLRSRVNVGVGGGAGLTPRSWGQQGGAETVTLNTTNLANHTHGQTMKGSTTAPESNSPNAALLAGAPIYTVLGAANETLRAGSIQVGNTGGGQSFGILMPYQVIKTCIATQGIFPSRN